MPHVVGIELPPGVIEYFEDKVRHFFGKDAASQAAARAVKAQIQSAAQEATRIQCFGMDPISLHAIYRPVKLIPLGVRPSRTVPAIEMIEGNEDAIIFGGPGHGKTTLVHWVWTAHLRSQKTMPMLFTLRRPEALAAFFKFIRILKRRGMPQAIGKKRVILLVDGYDEVSSRERLDISDALIAFQGLDIGTFILTCRDHFDVPNVTASRWRVAPFDRETAKEYILAFAAAHAVRIRADKLLSELEKSKLHLFITHPLLLTLVCVLQVDSKRGLPRDTINLIRDAIQTLIERWDAKKGIHPRPSRLNGDHRVRCLRRIAFEMPGPTETEIKVEEIVSQQLRLLQHSDIEVSVLLNEIAQFYGLFLPVENRRWEFTHRLIQDFLAAEYWTRPPQRFDPSQVRTWDYRAAYAACLESDATASLENALSSADDLRVLIEVLSNRCPFDPAKVAMAVVQFFDSPVRRIRIDPLPTDPSATSSSAEIDRELDFWGLVSDDFLDALTAEAVKRSSTVHQVLAAYSLSEQHERGRRLSPSLYGKCRDRYRSDAFQISALRRRGWSRVMLGTLAPHAGHPRSRPRRGLR